MRPPVYEFGPFRLDSGSRLLSRQGEVVSLTPKAADLLLFLIQNRGRLVAKEELISAVWPDTFVEESNLTYYISIVRICLGERQDGGEYIETFSRRGYRFAAPVNEA